MEGMGDIQANIRALRFRLMSAASDAADESAHLLEAYAKTHHGTTPRQAGWVYPGGGRWETVNNIYNRGVEGLASASVFRATRRWREAGIGWGDVTGNLNNSTRGSSQMFGGTARIAVSASMEYAPFLEVRNHGRWAWLWPAVAENTDNVMKIFRRHMSSAIEGFGSVDSGTFTRRKI